MSAAVTKLHADELSVSCTQCGAAAQQPCKITVGYLRRRYHLARVDALHKLLQSRRPQG